MKRILLGLSVLVGAASAACASVIAKAPAERPPLEVPAPPAKVVEPPPRPDPGPDPVPDLPPAQPSNSRPPRQPPREQARTDPKPEATTTTTEATAPPPPVAAAPQLRTPGTPDAGEAAKQVNDILDRVNKTLSSIDARRFPKTRKEQYDTAKHLVTQSQEALKKSDFENARKLATKAEDMANELKGR